MNKAYKHLMEADTAEEAEEKDEKNKEEIAKSSLHGNPDLNKQVPLSNDKFEPVQDGNIPQNSEGITSGQYDALNATGQEQIVFQNGNYKQVVGYPKLVQDKITSLTQTFVPLIEVALIELLGNSQMYQRQTGDVVMSFQNNQLAISFTFVYVVNNFIGTDIDLSAIQHDSNYILMKIKQSGANITKCEISTESGQITIMGSL
jgi:hypothetical protein